MAHTAPSSPRSPLTGDEGRQVLETAGTKKTRRRPMATPPPTCADASLEVSRTILKAMQKWTKASKKAGGLSVAALDAVTERLSLPEVNEQVEELIASESTESRGKIASTLAGMLEKDNDVFTAELEAYDLDLSVVIQQATESVESSPEFSRYLQKAPSETSADADSPDRSRQASQGNRPRHRSLSSSGKSEFFLGKNFESFAIDSSKTRELKAELYQAQNALAEKKGSETAWKTEKETWQRERETWERERETWERERETWERERATWAKVEQRLEQLADGYKQDKADYKQDKEKWETRYTEDKAEWQKQAQKWENRYENELQKREALDEELKALRERLRPSA